VNPSGKLPETFPARIEDNSAYLHFGGDRRTVEYREGVFVGYRHHDSARVAPLFPFGHGLSYTTFAYSDLRLDRPRIDERDTLSVSLQVENTGPVAGQEVVQLYVKDDQASVVRPEKELKGFEKVALAPGERREVRFTLSRRAFAFWDVRSHGWVVEPGSFTILVGASSRDLRLSARVEVEARPPVRAYDQNSSMGEVLDHPAVGPWAQRLAARYYDALGKYEPGTPEAAMTEAMFREMPLRNMIRLARALTPAQLEVVLQVLNGSTPASALPQV